MKIKEALVWRILMYLVLFCGVVLVTAPMVVVVINSMKTTQEAGQNFFALPSSFYLGNFKELFEKNNYWVYMRNSALITLISVALVVIFVPALSYSIARNYERRFYKSVYVILLLGLFVPFQIIMLPLVKQMTRLNLLNHTGLILIYLAFSLSKGAFLFVSYIRALPSEIEEAARIDGCSTFQTYVQVVIYLIKPMIATIVIMDALWFWNDFMMPLMMLNKTSSYWTLPLFQYNFKAEYSFNYTMAFTAYLVSMIPIIVVYAFLQKYIIRGLTAGAVKS